MKEAFYVLLTLTLFAQARANPASPLHFVPMKRFEQKEGLPPRLYGVFDVDCGDTFVKTVRFEETDAKGVVHIHVGGLVRENLLSSCVGEARELSAEAGTTFSGRAFEVHAIEPPGPGKVRGGRSEGKKK